MRKLKLILTALFIGAFVLGISAQEQDDKSKKKKKEKKTYEEKSTAGKGVSKAGDGVETGWKETKEFFAGEETEEDKAKKESKKKEKEEKKAKKKDGKK